jgi:hypothetical protein
MSIESVAVALKNPKLNLMEQARLLQSLEPRRRSVHGLTLREIGKRLGKSYVWVRRRLALLELPLEVQEAAEAGFFTPSDLETVISLRKARWKRAALRVLRERKAGQQVAVNDLSHKTTRKSHERIQQMIRYLMSKNIGGLPIRLLAWCLGRVDDKQIYAEVKEVLNGDENEEDVPVPRRIDRP